ncbi:ankyrin repeat domain-containing protein 17-like isoform X2 [Corticium candelabrum]|uniref:ankyrin repeat domain-containing protein 17-like isoform X2 n=1 Tax=Corticium candelabrum TaxID=121492 RepID=UPI002E2640E1|nr:ankyrin repeat domain-containing protein 17-like isoform X2 [Corticium candelabrum]
MATADLLRSLNTACKGGKVSDVIAILSNDFESDQNPTVLSSSLIMAASHGQLDVISVLLNAGADVNFQSSNEFGTFPLGSAAFAGHKDIVEVFLESGAYIDMERKDGGTALYSACFQRHKDVVDLLLHLGCCASIATKNGRSPLQAAAYHGDTDVVLKLLQHGAKTYGTTPLHTAAYNGDIATVCILLRYGADTSARTNKGGTPFQLASVKGHTECASIIDGWNVTNALKCDMIKHTPPLYVKHEEYEEASASQRRISFLQYKELKERYELLLSTWEETKCDNKQLQIHIDELEQKLADVDPTNTPDGVCSYQQECEAFFKSLGVEQRFLSPEFNKCYCPRCYNGRPIILRGKPAKPYAIPRGWVRFAITVDSRLNADEIFDSYHVAFHGTSAGAVKSILESGQLLLPGDTTSGGFTIPHPSGHIKDGKCCLIPGHMDGHFKVVAKHKANCKCGCVLFEPTRLFFTSPTVKYCEDPAYAGRGVKFGKKRAKCVLQVRQKSDSYKVLAETIGAGRRSEVIDPLFDNRDVEWCTGHRYPAIVVTGVLIKLL